MADFVVKYVAHYQITARRYRCSEKYETKEFDHKWQAEKFLEEWKRDHWFASCGRVESKVIDLRSESQKARDEREHERCYRTVDKYLNRYFR